MYFAILHDATPSGIKDLLTQYKKQKNIKVYTKEYPDGVLFSEILAFCKSINSLHNADVRSILNRKKSSRFTCPKEDLLKHLNRFNLEADRGVFMSSLFHVFYLEKAENGLYIFEPNYVNKNAIIPTLKSMEEVAQTILNNFAMFMGKNKCISFSMHDISYQKEKNQALEKLKINALDLNDENINLLIKEFDLAHISPSEFIFELNDILQVIALTSTSQQIENLIKLLEPLLKIESDFFNETMQLCENYLLEPTFFNSESLIHHAAFYADLHLLKELVKRGADINQIESRLNNTPLQLAVAYQNILVVKYLINRPEINLNLTNKTGFTALIMAVENGNEAVTQLLLNQPTIEVNTHTKTGWTALIMAVDKGKINITELLLKHPTIDVNLAQDDGKTALMLAIDNGNEAIIKLLLDHPKIDINFKDKNGFTALILAITKNNMNIYNLFPKDKLNINSPTITLNILFSIITQREYFREVMKEVFESKLVKSLGSITAAQVTFNQPTVTPLHYAIALNQTDMVKAIIKDGADINKGLCGVLPIDLAKAVGNKEIVKLISDQSKQSQHIQVKPQN